MQSLAPSSHRATHRHDVRGQASRRQALEELHCLDPLARLRASAQRRVDAHDVGLDAGVLHRLVHQCKGCTPLLTLLASADRCIASDGVQLQSAANHLIQRVTCGNPSRSFRAGADGRAESDHGGLASARTHQRQHLQSLLPPMAPLAGRHGSTERDHIGLHALQTHLLQRLEGPRGLRACSEGAYQRTEHPDVRLEAPRAHGLPRGQGIAPSATTALCGDQGGVVLSAAEQTLALQQAPPSLLRQPCNIWLLQPRNERVPPAGCGGGSHRPRGRRPRHRIRHSHRPSTRSSPT
mmetsp:Transcript_88531/g.253543  ORF Transcript_88531/g.253543 Transcript_88531/m.253543 type:complete len:294 (-) Transcript_88531:7-888(-)